MVNAQLDYHICKSMIEIMSKILPQSGFPHPGQRPDWDSLGDLLTSLVFTKHVLMFTERHWIFLLETFLPINTLSNVSYSCYINHVQNYTLNYIMNWDFNDHWTSSQSATAGNPLFCNYDNKGNPWHRQCKCLQILADLVHLI